MLSIGDELTLGQALDTNSRWLSERLLELGIVPVEHATVPDDAGAIAAALKRLAARANVVISSGGLGPTPDDLTRRGLAMAMGEELVEDADALGAIRRWFAGRSSPMPEVNRVQAQRPEGARILPNAFGTAPGLWGELPGDRGPADGTGGNGVDVFCLPGPPREMRPMFEDSVRPRLNPPEGRLVRTRVLHSLGLGESDVAERLGELMGRGRTPLVGTTVSAAVVSVRLRFEGPADAGAAGPDSLMDETAAEVRARVGPYLFGEGQETIQSVLVGLLKERGAMLATAESCTGGLLGAAVTEVPGSSAAYAGGWVTYLNALKMGELGVPEALLGPGGPGAVSREVAEAMAAGARQRAGAAYALSITGIAGPEGGTPEKPVGTVWVGLAGAGLVRSRLFRFAGERANIREWSVKMSLAMLRLELIGRGELPLLREVSK
jgi:nicotinamide-nucleotide amidase